VPARRSEIAAAFDHLKGAGDFGKIVVDMGKY